MYISNFFPHNKPPETPNFNRVNETTGMIFRREAADQTIAHLPAMPAI
jgi:hypothetical protein